MPINILTSTMKYKDSNGVYQNVDVIKGQSGVYCGDSIPDDPDINVWIDPSAAASDPNRLPDPPSAVGVYTILLTINANNQISYEWVPYSGVLSATGGNSNE